MTPVYPNPKDPIFKAAKTIVKEREGEIKERPYETYNPAAHNYDTSRYSQGIRQIALTGTKR